AIACYVLFKAARQHFKVALSGDGADELLGGYSTYMASRVAPALRAAGGLGAGIINLASRLTPLRGSRYEFKDSLARLSHGARQGQFRDHAAWRLIASEAV